MVSDATIPVNFDIDLVIGNWDNLLMNTKNIANFKY